MYNLLNTITESINDRGRFKAIFIMGIPGAGKSHTQRSITDGTINPRIVNTDRMYEFMGKTGRADISADDGSGWKSVREVVMRTTENQLAQYINGVLPLIVDTTSSSVTAVLRRRGILESIGYDVGAIWVDVDLETALRRASERERHVSPRHIEDTFARAEKDKPFILSKFDFSTTINNNDGALTDQAILSAYRHVRRFYLEDIRNPVGQRTIEEMESKGDKYLTDSILTKQQLANLVNGWYNAR